MNNKRLSMFTSEDTEPPEVDGDPGGQRLGETVIVEENFVNLLKEMDKTNSPGPQYNTRGTGGVCDGV